MIKVGINMRTTVSFLSQFNYTWPDFVQNFLDTYGQTSGGITQAIALDCVLGNSVRPIFANMLLATLAPPVFVGIILIAFKANATAHHENTPTRSKPITVTT